MKTGFDRYELHPRVLEVLPQIGFTHVTPVQHKVIPLFIQKKNLIVEAATGTGKTAAYGLPLLSRLDYLKRSLQALILVPSRELAVQVESALNTFSTFPKLKIGAIYGGSSLQSGKDVIKNVPNVLVAVPGRLRDILHDDDFPWFWRNIKFLILDEADKLLEHGFQHELDLLIKNARKKAQVALFSATISDDVETMIRERFRPVMTIRMSPKEAVRNIFFHNINAQKGNTEHSLAGLIEQHHVPKALIFCNKRDEVLSVTNFLRSLGRKADPYYGHMDQVERKAVMHRFKTGMIDFLVATDLAARGLDVEYLPAVINFSFPQELDIYLHRAGRTGRAGLKGDCYNIISTKEEEIRIKSFQSQMEIPVKNISVTPVRPSEIRKRDTDKIAKAFFNRGKKDKIRKGDVVGFILNTIAIEVEEIGTIAIYDEHTIVDLPESVIGGLSNPDLNLKIKGKTLKVRKYGLKEQQARAKSVKKLVISSKKREELKKRKDKK